MKEHDITVRKKDQFGFDVSITRKRKKFVVSWDHLDLTFRHDEEEDAFGCFICGISNAGRLLLRVYNGKVYSKTIQMKTGRGWVEMRCKEKWWSPTYWRKSKKAVLKNAHLIYSKGHLSENKDQSGLRDGLRG